MKRSIAASKNSQRLTERNAGSAITRDVLNLFKNATADLLGILARDVGPELATAVGIFL
jgi:hypothetical protein